jgi:hypothetical protein
MAVLAVLILAFYRLDESALRALREGKALSPGSPTPAARPSG